MRAFGSQRGRLGKTLAIFLVVSTLVAFTFGSITYGTPGASISLVAAVSSAQKSSSEHRVTSVGPITGRIALVKPIFSDTAYSNAFYVFYTKYDSSNQTFITTDLEYLNVTVKSGWGHSTGLYDFLCSGKARQQGLTLGENVFLIDEIDVLKGGLFRDRQRAYDVLVLGFTEYVTAEEYNEYKKFVASGGALVLMDACNFYAEVKYYPPSSPGQSGYLSLVKGHGWEFNGTHAWKSVRHRWPDENRNWVGSNFWKYWDDKHYDYLIANTTHPISTNLRDSYGANISTTYGALEENVLENFTDTEVIGYWHLIEPSDYPGKPIVAYQHKYVNGSVFHSGILASFKVNQEEFLQAFLISAVRLALSGAVGDWHFPRDSTFEASLRLCSPIGAEVAPYEILSWTVYFYASFNTTSVARNGMFYDLSTIYLYVTPKLSSGSYSGSSFEIVTIEGFKTDASGLRWQMTLDTTAFSDGSYTLTISALFTASLTTEDVIWATLLSSDHTIQNNFFTRNALAVGLSSLVVVFVAVLVINSFYERRIGQKTVTHIRGGRRSRSSMFLTSVQAT